MTTQCSLDRFFGGSPAKKRSKISKEHDSLSRTKKTRETSQMIIDAGQRRFGLEHCKSCGMMYSVDSEEDNKKHNDFHNRFISTKYFQIRPSQFDLWEQCTRAISVTEPWPGTIYMVNSKCPTALKCKIDKLVTEFINVEIGLCEPTATWKPKRLAFVAIVKACEKSKTSAFVAGLTLVDPIQNAWLQPDNKKLFGTMVGINRIWVHSSQRRKGVAHMLVNTARRLTYPHGIATKTLPAFDDPIGPALQLAKSCLIHGIKYITYDADVKTLTE